MQNAGKVVASLIERRGRMETRTKYVYLPFCYTVKPRARLLSEHIVKRYTFAKYARSFFAHGCTEGKRARLLPVDEELIEI